MSGSNCTSCRRTQRNKCTKPWLQSGGRREGVKIGLKMTHRPWPGEETGRAQVTSRDIVLQEQPVQPVQPPRDTQCGSPSGQDAVTPPPPHAGRSAKRLESAGKWSGCVCGHGSNHPLPCGNGCNHPLPCGSSSQGWWLSMGLVVAHRPDGSAQIWPYPCVSPHSI